MTWRNLCPVCLHEIPRFRRGLYCSKRCERKAQEGT